MARNPPEGMQRVIPYLLYEDAPAALDYLVNVFGFVERYRVPAADGKIMHSEVALKDSVLMLATAVESMGHRSAKELPGRHSGVMCYVDDVDAHYAHAKAAGAEITAELEDKEYGDRMYGARDPEGQMFWFGTHVKDPEGGFDH